MGHREAGSPGDARSDAIPAPIDVLIIVALQDELEAVLAEGGGAAAWQESDDHVHVCTLQNNAGQPLVVAAAWTGAMGAAAAATRAATLVERLRPSCLAMCGICAGKRGDVALGDVIVADRVYSFDHGKLVAAADSKGLPNFYHDIKMYNLEHGWQMDAAAFRGDLGWATHLLPSRPRTKEAQIWWLLHTLYAQEHEGGPPPLAHDELATVFRIGAPNATDWAERVRELRKKQLLAPGPGVLKLTEAGRLQVEDDRLLHPRGAPPDPAFRVHVGPIATGNAVIEDPQIFGWLKRIGRKTVGLEMEAYAIGYVGDTLPRRAIVAKAVSDHADGDKDDRFREFACRASAAWLLAFLKKHLAPKAPEPRPSEHEDEPRTAPSLRPLFPDEDMHRVNALQRGVERALARRHGGAQMVWKRAPEEAPTPLRTFLEVHVPGGGYAETYPVAVIDGDVGEFVLDGFVTHVVSRYRDYTPYLEALMVHTGSSTDIGDHAPRLGVRLESLLELRGYLDFRPYVARQTGLLAFCSADPPTSFEPRRIAYRVGPYDHEKVDALEELDAWLGREGPQRVLLLGDLQIGKTSLMRRLALRLGTRRHVSVPVLIQLRDLENLHGLDALLAQHFPQHGMRRFDYEAFREMLVQGRIVMLFDGFDKLAERVTPETAAGHLDSVLQAAIGNAKVVITSLTKHFIDDQQRLHELGERVTRCGFRVARLLR